MATKIKPKKMALKEWLEHPRKNISGLKELETGKAKDIETFWKDFVEPRLPTRKTVNKWHKLLMMYVDDIKVGNCTVPLRIFGSDTDEKKDSEGKTLRRRGFINLVKESNLKTVYVDNSFTSYFCAMALSDYVPEYDEYKQMMDNRQFPCGFFGSGSKSDETKYRAFKPGRNPGISGKYKIAHIYSAGEEFKCDNSNIETIGQFCNQYFPQGMYKNWESTQEDTNGKFHYREVSINSNDIEEVKKFLIAHFLRIVHPLNYFLVPKKGFISFEGADGFKIEIGEYSPLIEFAKQKMKERYGRTKIYKDFIKMIYPKGDDFHSKNLGKTIINARYQSFKGKKSSSPKGQKRKFKKNIDEKTLANILYDYLFLKKSLREIEKNRFKFKEPHGGKARKILMEMDIKNSWKGRFEGKDIKTYTGRTQKEKEILAKIRTYLS